MVAARGGKIYAFVLISVHTTYMLIIYNLNPFSSKLMEMPSGVKYSQLYSIVIDPGHNSPPGSNTTD